MDLRHCNDIERLRQASLLLGHENKRLRQKLEQLVAENAKLGGKNQDLQKTLDLVAQSANADAVKEHRPASGKVRRNPSRRRRLKRREKEGSAKKAKGETGRTPQPALDIVEQRMLFTEQAEGDQRCPHCDIRMRPRPGDFEESELIDVVQVEYRVIKIMREKGICPECTHVHAAVAPEEPRRVRVKGRYTLAFITMVAIAKYLEHLPLARQVRSMERRGLKVTTQTLYDQLAALADLLTPTYRAIYWWLLDQRVIGTDQTRWPRLDNAKSDWQLWCVTHSDAAFFCVQEHKDTATTLALLQDFSGTVVCDEMKSLGAAAREGAGHFVEQRCWAHARAKFYDCEADFPDAAPVLDAIAELFAVEKRASLGSAELAQLRASESSEILSRIKGSLYQLRRLGHPSTLSISRATEYALRNWTPLTRFLDDPEIPLDNSLSEREFRAEVLGRKNHYGSKTQRGAYVSMLLYTLIATARLNGRDPAEFLINAARRAQDAIDFGVTLPFPHHPLAKPPPPLPWESDDTGLQPPQLMLQLDDTS